MPGGIRAGAVRVLQHALETSRLARIEIWRAQSHARTELDRSRGP